MRAFPPLRADHPLVTDHTACPYCENVFQAGDVVTLRGDTPADREEREKMWLGRPYIAMAHPIHAVCADALEGRSA